MNRALIKEFHDLLEYRRRAAMDRYTEKLHVGVPGSRVRLAQFIEIHGEKILAILKRVVPEIAAEATIPHDDDELRDLLAECLRSAARRCNLSGTYQQQLREAFSPYVEKVKETLGDLRTELKAAHEGWNTEPAAKWSFERPTKSGWYWEVGSFGVIPHVVLVTESNPGQVGDLIVVDYRRWPVRTPIDLDKFDASRWCPIPTAPSFSSEEDLDPIR